MWLAWEGVHAKEHGAAFARYRTLGIVGVLLALAALGLAVMGYVAFTDANHSNGTLVALVAFPAAVALGVGAVAVIQAALHLRRKVATTDCA
jgi:quinol-cytochrome oxidoreductase complex cytochrome b subunit